MALEAYFYDIANTMENNTSNSLFPHLPNVLGKIDDIES